MKMRLIIGFLAALACFVMPYICRFPQGVEWVEQYRPGDGYFSSGMLFFMSFSVIPCGVVFFAALVSKTRYYLPVLISTVTTLILLAYWHHDNDLASDAQAALSLIFFPIYTAVAGLLAAIIGLIIQGKWNQNNQPNKSLHPTASS